MNDLWLQLYLYVEHNVLAAPVSSVGCRGLDLLDNFVKNVKLSLHSPIPRRRTNICAEWGCGGTICWRENGPIPASNSSTPNSDNHKNDPEFSIEKHQVDVCLVFRVCCWWCLRNSNLGGTKNVPPQPHSTQKNERFPASNSENPNSDDDEDEDDPEFSIEKHQVDEFLDQGETSNLERFLYQLVFSLRTLEKLCSLANYDDPVASIICTQHRVMRKQCVMPAG